MEKYAVYKDSGIDWIGTYPCNWDIKKVSYLFSSIGSGTTPSMDDSNEEATIPWLNSADLTDGFVTECKNKITSEVFQKYSALKIFPAGSLVIAMYGATIGKLGITQEPLCTNQACCVVGGCKEIQTKFAFYSFLAMRKYLLSIAYGGGQPNISQTSIKSLRLCVPSQIIQNSVISYLDRKTTQIDSIIADKEKLIDLLKEKRQAIISEAVTKGLDPSVLMKDSGVDWIGQIPAHWEVKPMFTVACENKMKNEGLQCNNLLSLSYGKIVNKDIETNFGLLPESFENYQIVEEGYSILRLTDLQNDKRSLRSGYVPEKGIITSAYVGLIPSPTVDGLFLSDLLHAYDLMKIFYGLGNGVRQSMSYKDLKRLPILIPPKEEQISISQYLKDKSEQIDGIVLLAEQEIALLKEYRQSIISEAVTGKFMVPAQQEESPVKQAKTQFGGANIHFKRSLVAAKILDKLCGEPTLGHVKLEKLLFLSEYCAELDMHTEYGRHAAGPYNPQVLRSVDSQLKKASWFAYDKNNYGSKYSRLTKSDAYTPYFEANFTETQGAEIDRIIELLRPLDTERCEIIATLYGAWNDFLINKAQPTDEQIVDEVLNRWSDEKKKISRDRWLKALPWMRQHQIVPYGYGGKTKRRDK